MESYAHDGLTFDVTDTGGGDNGTLLALHGFPEDRHCWDKLSTTFADHGYRTVAPDQRGYSPGARPEGRRSYRVGLLAGDVLALADRIEVDRFDVVGHDWGAAVAWYLAAAHPDRVRTLTALSVPHPAAFQKAMGTSTQLLHSWYMAFFQMPRVPELVLGRHGGADFADSMVRSGLDRPTADRYGARAGTRGAMTGPINWYRALPLSGRDRMPAVTVPTLYCWGSRDGFITRQAAELCAEQVKGPYQFAELEGQPHWLPTKSADLVAPLVLDLLGRAEPVPRG